jgi:hypothetical protein
MPRSRSRSRARRKIRALKVHAPKKIVADLENISRLIGGPRIESTSETQADVIVRKQISYEMLRALMEKWKVCFHGNNLVINKQGQMLRICELKSGDELDQGTIKYVIKMSGHPVVDVGDGILLTRNHPIFVNNTWIKAQGVAVDHPDAVYNIVWEKDHCRDRRCIVLNNIPCAVWGHEDQGELAHDVFGHVSLILQDLHANPLTGQIELM